MDNRGTLLVPAIITLAAAAMRLDPGSGNPGKVIRGKFPLREPDRYDVFVSYWHDDQRFWNEIIPFLEPLKRNKITIYSYDMVEPGGQIRKEAQAALMSSAVAVLLLSQDYIASDLMTSELPNLLERVEEGTLMLTVHVGLHDAHGLDRVTRYQRVGDSYGKPLEELSKPKRKHVYLELVQAIRGKLMEAGRYPI
jgi:hypothetical protein